MTWDYTERLIIDRKTETLEHIQNIGTGCKVSRKYEIEGGIESLLENFDAEDLFTHIEGNPDDVIETPNEEKDYTMTIDYKKVRVAPLREVMTKMDFQKISRILQKQYLILFVFMDWQKYLIRQYIEKQNAENLNISFVA